MLISLFFGMLTLAFDILHGECSESPATEWTRAYGGADYDCAFSVVEASDGGYVLAGFTKSFGAGNYDPWLVKTDDDGNIQWNRTYGGANYDCANSVVETAGGGYALFGHTSSFGAGENDFWLVKVDSAGNHEWNQTYGGPDNDYGESIIETSDGGYVLAGRTFSLGAGSGDFWLVKVDSAGNHEWNQTYGGTDFDYGFSVVEASDGGYVLAGWTRSFGAGDYDFWLVKTDDDGNMQWNRTYGGANDDRTDSVVETYDGGYAIAGYTGSHLNYDVWLVKTDSAGNMQWNKTYGGPDNDEARSIVEASDGGYVLAGLTKSFGAGGNDFWLVKVDSDGNHQWNKTYGGGNSELATSVVETVDGGYAIAGYTSSFDVGGGDFWLVKVAPEQHDLAIVDVVLSKTIVGQGYSLDINVTAENQGDLTETFNVTVYGNTTIIGTKGIVLTSGNSANIPFTWNTTGWDIGNYTVSANATILPNETDTNDNIYVNGMVTVRLPIYDIAITNVTPSKTVVCQNHTMYINLTVENQGDFTETFNVTLYANNTFESHNMQSLLTVDLDPGENDTFTIIWNTTSFAKGNYTIEAVADIILGEIETTDNSFTDGWVIVAMVGDITGPDDWPDGECEMRDVGLVARYFGEDVPPAPANCDLTGPTTGVPDGTVDMRDVGLVARHFGETDP